MNNKCTIDLNILNKYDFKYILTYRVLFDIMRNYDIEVGRIKLDPRELIIKFGTCHTTMKNTMNELIDNNIVTKAPNCKYWYKVNHKLFLAFDKVNTYKVCCENKHCKHTEVYRNYPSSELLKDNGWQLKYGRWFCSSQCLIDYNQYKHKDAE